VQARLGCGAVAALPDLLGVVEPKDVVLAEDDSEAGAETICLPWLDLLSVEELREIDTSADTVVIRGRGRRTVTAFGRVCRVTLPSLCSK
jgi:hypothetical protein